MASVIDTNEKYIIQGITALLIEIFCYWLVSLILCLFRFAYSLGVHDNFDIQPSGYFWGTDEPRFVQLVFIGKNLNEKLLENEITKFLQA
jgi:hypothetical protein